MMFSYLVSVVLVSYEKAEEFEVLVGSYGWDSLEDALRCTTAGKWRELLGSAGVSAKPEDPHLLVPLLRDLWAKHPGDVWRTAMMAPGSEAALATIRTGPMTCDEKGALRPARWAKLETVPLPVFVANDLSSPCPTLRLAPRVTRLVERNRSRV